MNAHASCDKIEDLTQSLASACAKLVENGTLFAGALYLPSAHANDHVFALTQDLRGPHKFRRSDKVWRRRLGPNQSAAAQAFNDRAPSITPSLMFPDQHQCMHLPIKGGLLQFAFANQSTLSNTQKLSLIKNAPQIAPIEREITKITRAAKGNLDDYFNVVAAYQPNAIAILCDMSGFKSHAQKLGYRRTQIAAREFCHTLLPTLADQYNIDIVRFTGDGAWMIAPFNMTSPQSKNTAARNAINFSKTLQETFPIFMGRQDPAMKNIPLRITFDEGEVGLQNTQLSLNDPNDISGQIFTHIQELDSQASRKTSTLQIGADLQTYIQQQNNLPKI